MQEKMVQYKFFEDGYLPAPETARQLPSGAYQPAGGYDVAAQKHLTYLKPMNVVTDDLIRFPDMVLQNVTDEVEEFWKQKEQYTKLGFRHKRGYLFYGPPGSGKSCLINMIMEYMINHGNIVMYVSNPGATSAALSQFRTIEPDRQLLVIFEDLDAMLKNEHDEAIVLSMLDGESKIDNVINVATTNYPRELDARLLNRPGRFDRVINIDLPSEAMRRQFLEKKMGMTEKDGVNFLKITEELSLGHLREFVIQVCIQHKDPTEVAEGLQKMKYMPKSNNNGQSGMGFGGGTPVAPPVRPVS